jgi:hypothetical protein
LSMVSLDSTSRVIVLPVTVGGQYCCAASVWTGRQTGLHENLHDDLVMLALIKRSVLAGISYLDKALSSSVKCKVVLRKRVNLRVSQRSKFSADASETWRMTNPRHTENPIYRQSACSTKTSLSAVSCFIPRYSLS